MADTPDKFQKQAIEHDINKPLLVTAGPGSGKTKVITHRVKFLLDNKTKPDEILCLTFGEKAAEEMEERLEKMNIDTTDMQISTFHSFCMDILSDNVYDTGIGMHAGVIDRAGLVVWALENIDSFNFDQHITLGNNHVEVIEAMIEGISCFKYESVTPKQLKDYVDKKLASGNVTAVSELDELYRNGNLYKVFNKMGEYLKKQDLISFEEMINYTNQFFERPEKKHVLESYQNKYKHIFVDEFQDNNYSQFSLVKKLVKDGNITAVGDEDQCIYRFQGAYAGIFDDFRKTFGPNYTEILLPNNYRCTESVVKLSSHLMTSEKGRTAKPLTSVKTKDNKVSVRQCKREIDQAEFIKKKIKEILKKNGKNVSLNDFAVLSRTRARGKNIAEALVADGINVNYVGKAKISSAKSGRLMSFYLQFASDPSNAGQAIGSILSEHGISELNISKINYVANSLVWKNRNVNFNNADFVYDVLTTQNISNLTQKKEFSDVIKTLSNILDTVKHESVKETVRQIMMKHTSLYKDATKDDSFESFVERIILNQLYEFSSQFELQKPKGTISEFLAWLEAMEKIDVDLDEGEEYTNAVQVSTIHKSKGKEFRYVFITDVISARLPLNYKARKFFVPDEISHGLKLGSDAKEEHTKEERRCFYVAMTRAIDNLFILYPATYDGSGTACPKSQFIKDLHVNVNPNIDFDTFSPRTKKKDDVSSDKFEILKHEIKTLAEKHIGQMQLESAVARIVDLARIEHYKKHNTLKGFDPKKILTKQENKALETKLKKKKPKGFVDPAKLNLSPSKLENYETCPKQFRYAHILKTPPRKPAAVGAAINQSAPTGTMFHKVVEMSAIKQRDQGVKETYSQLCKNLEKIWDYRLFMDGSKTEEAIAKNTVMKALKVYADWNKQNKNQIIGVEKDGGEFRLKIGGVNVKGRIDRLEKNPQGKYEVIDYKTGKYDKKKVQTEIKTDFQLHCYAMGVKKLHSDLPEIASRFYVGDNQDSTGASINPMESIGFESLNKAVHANVKKTMEQIVKNIKDEKFPADPGWKKCEYCSYWEVCEESSYKK